MAVPSMDEVINLAGAAQQSDLRLDGQGVIAEAGKIQPKIRALGSTTEARTIQDRVIARDLVIG